MKEKGDLRISEELADLSRQVDVDGFATIWLPPCDFQVNEEEGSVIYPFTVPSSLPSDDPLDDPSYESDDPPDGEKAHPILPWYRTVSRLRRNKWRKKQDLIPDLRDQTELLRGLRRLVPIKEGGTELLPGHGAVRNFVTEWGPLWKCRTHNDCYCDFYELARTPFSIGKCTWRPVEWIAEFADLAIKIESSLEIGSYLLGGKRAPGKLWYDLRGDAEQEDEDRQPITIYPVSDLEGQKYSLTRFIKMQLSACGFGFGLEWPDGQGRPEFRIHTGLGFRGAAWVAVGQILSGANYLEICDGCNLPYVRERRARRDRQNYCDTCQRGKKAYMAKKRWRERQRIQSGRQE